MKNHHYIELGSISQNRRVNGKKSQQRWVKSASLILGLALLIFSIKLLIQPVSSALGSFWQGSTTLMANALNGPRSLKKENNVTNILLVGIDRRSYAAYQVVADDGQSLKNGFLADTIIVGSYHHETGRTTLLSLPRDLWVKMPGFNQVYEQHTKINAVHAYGDQYDYPGGGGLGLLKEVVSQILGVPIHYAARVDFEAFEKIIDSLSGIKVEIERGFDDYLYPVEGCEDCAWDERFEHVHFEAGLQHLDGEKALKFARSRQALGPEGNDFARARRQQKVILAVRNKALSAETLLNLEKLRQLYLTLSEHIVTDIQLNELPLFYSLGKQIGQQEIKSYVLSPPTGEQRPEELLAHPGDLEGFGGAWVLVPRAGVGDFSEIQDFVQQIFYSQS